MQTEFILWIGAQTAIPSLVGVKAATLSTLCGAGIPIPNGFCVTTEVYSTFKKGNVAQHVRMAIRESARALLGASGTGKLIVRSSALQEDGLNSLFPGVFSSIFDVENEIDCVDAIWTCMQSTRSERAGAYCRLMGTRLDDIKMAVLVQEQMDPLFAGVAFTESPLEQHHGRRGVLVELVSGQGRALLAGTQPDGAFWLETGDAKLSIQPLTRHAGLVSIELTRVLSELHDLCLTTEATIGSGPQDIEWCSDPTGLMILQSRHLPKRLHGQAARAGVRASRILSETILPEEEQYGLKGAAMMKFRSLGWFHKPIVFLRPQSDLDAFLSLMESVDFGKGGITIRYSCRDDIGLPRMFAHDVNLAKRLIHETWQPDWLGIVHAYIDVRESFELYLDSEYSVLEHVPGIWESDNTLAPDVVIMKAQDIDVFRVSGSRVAKLLGPNGQSREVVEALEFSKLEAWMVASRKYIAILRDTCVDHLPILCHFVGDDRGVWHFLNLRKSKVIPRGADDLPLRFHVVSNVRDLDNWNGDDPILLQIAIERGYESLLEIIAEKLPETEGSVFIDFGVLSHPAIALREMGIQAIPAYLSHERRSEKVLT